MSHSVSRMLHFCNWHLISKAAKLSIVFMHAALPLKVIPIVGTQSRLVETLGDPAHPRCSKLFTFPRTTWKGDWLPQNDNRIPVRSNGAHKEQVRKDCAEGRFDALKSVTLTAAANVRICASQVNEILGTCLLPADVPLGFPLDSWEFCYTFEGFVVRSVFLWH